MVKHTPENLRCGDNVFVPIGNKIVPACIKNIIEHDNGHIICVCTPKESFSEWGDIDMPPEFLFKDYDELFMAMNAEAEAEINQFAERMSNVADLVKFLWGECRLEHEAKIAAKRRAKELLGIDLA